MGISKQNWLEKPANKGVFVAANQQSEIQTYSKHGTKKNGLDRSKPLILLASPTGFEPVLSP
jgi:hypothetical protein